MQGGIRTHPKIRKRNPSRIKRYRSIRRNSARTG